MKPNRQHAQTPLARFIRLTMRKGYLSLREVAEKSGGKVSNSYLSQLLSGKAKNPSVGKLKAIAKGLGVELSELTERL